MKGTILKASSALCVLALSGCMATGGESSLLSNDWESMSCDEINSAITSYNDANSTVDSMTSLASAVGVDTSAVDSAQAQGDNILVRAKRVARPIAEQKDCQIDW
ncbi:MULTISPECIES: hypothetical protein [unclassified Salinivibrio]|uniref:hypothetical protein n=1 Tax=unclassified Salinivibrio TaxID=2636825 RepID=UPI0009885463|nr:MULTISPECIES: hypothetical protein [unclassified Salinivibrio]OOE63799.1 hypothetical protein BZG14_08585 [Salinivibrio sp. IB282]